MQPLSLLCAQLHTTDSKHSHKKLNKPPQYGDFALWPSFALVLALTLTLSPNTWPFLWKQFRQHPHVSKKVWPPNMPYNEGSYGIKIPCLSEESKDFHRLLWHTNPNLYGIRTLTFMAYGLFLIVRTALLQSIRHDECSFRERGFCHGFLCDFFSEKRCRKIRSAGRGAR